MKKIMFYDILIALFIVVLLLILINPLRGPMIYIKLKMLHLTPIGTSMEDVIKVIERQKKWRIDYINYEYGYLVFDGRPSDPIYVDASEDTIMGEKSLRAHVGGYRNIFVTDVIVFWGFDENSKLISIHVRKDVDAL